MTPVALSQALEEYLGERRAQILSSGERSASGYRFSWCGDVLEFLVEGLAERFAARGITFTSPFPGPFRLWDEDQHPDGEHVRRFWTTALDRGCPVAKLCTFFFHRHDTPSLPRAPKVVGFPPDYRDGIGDDAA
jgi:hypothetical protein